MCFLVPTSFAGRVLKVLEDCREKKMQWSLGNEALSAEVALGLPTELGITVVPTFPALLYKDEDSHTESEKEVLEEVKTVEDEDSTEEDEKEVRLLEVEAVEILKTNDKNPPRLKKNHLVYHVYAHKRPYESWKAALKIDKDEHFVMVELLEEMVSEDDYENADFDECHQVLNIQLWSEAEVVAHGFSKRPPPVMDDMVKRLRKNVERKKEKAVYLYEYVEWSMDFCWESNATCHWQV